MSEGYFGAIDNFAVIVGEKPMTDGDMAAVIRKKGKAS